MRIAVDAGFLESHNHPDLKNFTEEVFFRLAKKYPHHQFFFLLNKIPASSLLPGNVTPIVIPARTQNFFSNKWLYEVKLPTLLKKHDIDVFVGTYGEGCVSCSIPQVIIVHNSSSSSKKNISFSLVAFFKEIIIRQLFKKAKAIGSPSKVIEEALISKFKGLDGKISTIGSGVNILYKSLEWEQREQVKDQYTQSCDYFIFPVGANEPKTTLNTLKAFSIFKKWQKTNMKLVLRGVGAKMNIKLSEKLGNYKFRNEVILLPAEKPDELAEITAAAYAMIFLSAKKDFATPVLEALQCRIPVITSPGSSMAWIAEDAALYANAESPEEIAEKMKLLYKDEQLRTKLIENGKHRLPLFNWDNTAALTWQLIEQAVSK